MQSPLFAHEQTPAEVVASIRAADARWDELDEPDRALGVAKLRLAGVYDDRQDGWFMLRTRIPGGRLTAAQLVAVAEVAGEFSHKPADQEGPERFAEITTRQGLQVHWIRFEDLPEIWRRYEAVGLTSEQACGDTLRSITSCPVDGLLPGAVLEAGPVVDGLTTLTRDEPRLTAFLPRKFKVAVTGCPTDCVVARLHDLAFTPARRGNRLGFNVHAGGGLSDSPRLASALELFVEPARVRATVRAALELFAERGDYRHKAVNRFRFLVHDLGPRTVGEEIRRRMPTGVEPAGDDLSTWRPEDHVGVYPDKTGTSYVGLCVPLGRLGADDLAELARLARTYGDDSIRLTQRQNLVLTGVRDVDALDAEPLLVRFSPEPDPFARAVVACTSAPFCKFGIVNAKAHGGELIKTLRNGFPPAAAAKLAGLRVHVSGCKASCALVQIAHVGLRGTMGKDQGAYADAFDIAVGGDTGDRRLARWARLAVPAEQAFDGLAEALAVVAAGRLTLEELSPETVGHHFRKDER